MLTLSILPTNVDGVNIKTRERFKEMRKYHHGDARCALIEAAAEIIEDTGASNLSLRQVAERAGVSRQAPYNHFKDKEALLAALATKSFDDLSSELAKIYESPSARKLYDAARTYIGFAISNPAHFRLMFSREMVDISKFPDSQKAAEKAFGLLASIVEEVKGFKSEELSIAAWCLVHGYATLCVEARLEESGKIEERARLFASIICSAQ